jgi:hypothetical protein
MLAYAAAALGAALALNRKRGGGLEEFGVVDDDVLIAKSESIMKRQESLLEAVVDQISTESKHDLQDCKNRYVFIREIERGFATSRHLHNFVEDMLNMVATSPERSALKKRNLGAWRQRESLMDPFQQTMGKWSVDCIVDGEGALTGIKAAVKGLEHDIRLFGEAKSCEDKFEAVKAIVFLQSEIESFATRREGIFSDSDSEILKEIKKGNALSDGAADAAIEFYNQTCLGKRPVAVEPPKQKGLVLTPKEQKDVKFLLHFDPSLTPGQIEKSILKAREDRKAREEHRRRMDVAKRKEFERKRGLSGFRSRRRRRRFGPATVPV